MSAYKVEKTDAEWREQLSPMDYQVTRQAATERGLHDGTHVITLNRSLIEPFLTFSERRDLREAAWRAWVGRGERLVLHSLSSACA